MLTHARGVGEHDPHPPSDKTKIDDLYISFMDRLKYFDSLGYVKDITFTVYYKTNSEKDVTIPFQAKRKKKSR